MTAAFQKTKYYIGRAAAFRCQITESKGDEYAACVPVALAKKESYAME